jgi:hypothetical protein
MSPSLYISSIITSRLSNCATSKKHTAQICPWTREHNGGLLCVLSALYRRSKHPRPSLWSRKLHGLPVILGDYENQEWIDAWPLCCLSLRKKANVRTLFSASCAPKQLGLNPMWGVHCIELNHLCYTAQKKKLTKNVRFVHPTISTATYLACSSEPPSEYQNLVRLEA